MANSQRKPALGPIGGELTEPDRVAIAALSDIIKELTGVHLVERHQLMIASRLSKRLSDLSLSSLSDYVTYFSNHREQEKPYLIGTLTTHHTYFFREFVHFELLRDQILPSLLPRVRNRPQKTLHVLVAACSRGHEVYSLAMILALHAPDVDFRIYGTDVDSESVAIARNGVYSYVALVGRRAGTLKEACGEHDDRASGVAPRLRTVKIIPTDTG